MPPETVSKQPHPGPSTCLGLGLGLGLLFEKEGKEKEKRCKGGYDGEKTFALRKMEKLGRFRKLRLCDDGGEDSRATETTLRHK